MKQIINWILKEKEWFFSGIGVFLVSVVIALFKYFQQTTKKGKKSAAKNNGNNLAATFFITVLTPLLTFIIVLKYIDDNPATKPKSLWEAILVLLMAAAVKTASARIVCKQGFPEVRPNPNKGKGGIFAANMPLLRSLDRGL